MELTTLIPNPFSQPWEKGSKAIVVLEPFSQCQKNGQHMIDDEIWRDKKLDHLQITT
jgi:hypothetical protein